MFKFLFENQRIFIQGPETVINIIKIQYQVSIVILKQLNTKI